jgi:predicted polyphosphate/ATP-dependent NAD kinase
VNAIFLFIHLLYLAVLEVDTSLTIINLLKRIKLLEYQNFLVGIFMKKLGLVVNPIAGMGGKVGLKGTDGLDTLQRAKALGAKPMASQRAIEMLSELWKLQKNIQIYTAPKTMGEDEAKKVGYKPFVIGKPTGKMTSAKETIKTCKMLLQEDVDLLVFCGGDGTAFDVYKAIDQKLPAIGIPTGVKMFSAVFALTPKVGAKIIDDYLRGNLGLKEAEVLDINEDAYRQGILAPTLIGYLQVPSQPILIQGSKAATLGDPTERNNQEAIGRQIVKEMKSGYIYVLGPGTTIRAIATVLGLKKTLLGIDLYYQEKIIKYDVNEKEILSHIKDGKTKLIISPIGRQGFILGRGNLQLSPKVLTKISKKNIIIVATKHKLAGLKQLIVDTGDENLNKKLRGYWRVTIDYNEEKIVKVE